MSNITRMNYVEKAIFLALLWGGSAIIALYDVSIPFLTGPEAWVPLANTFINMGAWWVFCWFLSRFIFTIGGRFKS